MTDQPSSVSGVAERYASALFELARDTSSLETVESDLKAFREMLKDSDELRRLESAEPRAPIVVRVGRLDPPSYPVYVGGGHARRHGIARYGGREHHRRAWSRSGFSPGSRIRNPALRGGHASRPGTHRW